MKIMAQEEYGLRCLLRFALAGRDRWLTIPEIAEAEKLSVPYVAKLLGVLRQAGLLESARGRAGGYRLSALPANIGLGSVLRALGEPLFEDPGFCDSHAGTESEGACVHRDACTLKVFWHSLERWMQGLLDRLTLADLAHNEGRIPELFQSALADADRSTPLVRLNSRAGGLKEKP